MRTILGCCALAFLLFCVGCTETIREVVAPSDLSPPLGLQSITGDSMVTLFWWCSNYEDDLDGYIIYYQQGEYEDDPQEDIPTGFVLVDSLEVTPPSAGQLWVDIGGLSNGQTYSFLVVAAMDDWGSISNTSNIIEDTPRAETVGDDTIYDYDDQPDLAAFEFADFSVASCETLDLNWNTPSGLGDLMYEVFSPGAGFPLRPWINGINGGEVQDIGYMADWDDADVAPSLGYAETGHSLEVLMGHVYAVKTGDDHYAKIHVTGIDGDLDWIRFKSAYQPDTGNPEYK